MSHITNTEKGALKPTQGMTDNLVNIIVEYPVKKAKFK